MWAPLCSAMLRVINGDVECGMWDAKYYIDEKRKS
jgi:hypothetical protein